MSGSQWLTIHQRGSATHFHHLGMPDPFEHQVWWFDLESPAIALGSTQPHEVLDAARAVEAGFEVVRRRSGGGAVLLQPGDVSWVDVFLPASDPRWELDVGRSFAWLGKVWVETLARLGIEGAIAHDGPMVRNRWSDLVCFAGLGPGEVTLAGRKVVGISQRRTRDGARYQCALLHRWDPAPLLEVCALGPDERLAAMADLSEVGAGIGPQPRDAVVNALQASMGAPQT